MLYLMSKGSIIKDLEQVIIMCGELCSRILTLIANVKNECPVSGDRFRDDCIGLRQYMQRLEERCL